LDAAEVLLIEGALEKTDYKNFVILQAARLIDPASIK
jgi:hypothetical protein